MNTISVSAAFTTKNVEATRDFYVKYFGAKVTFDCGWYINLEFGNPCSTLQFMSVQQPHHKLSSSDGLMYNFKVNEVDAEHKRLSAAGLPVIIPLENHPWGDRGFGVQDPNGIALYVYQEMEPSAEFRQYYKS
jgi:uncharacterized glyoxalase superfamily protein PhnB